MKLGIPIIKQNFTKYHHANDTINRTIIKGTYYVNPVSWIDSTATHRNFGYYDGKKIYFTDKEMLAEEDYYFGNRNTKADSQYYALHPLGPYPSTEELLLYYRCYILGERDAITVTYVYKQEGKFKNFSLGFNCELYHTDKNTFEKIHLSTAEELLKNWGLARLNY